MISICAATHMLIWAAPSHGGGGNTWKLSTSLSSALVEQKCFKSIFIFYLALRLTLPASSKRTTPKESTKSHSPKPNHVCGNNGSSPSVGCISSCEYCSQVLPRAKHKHTSRIPVFTALPLELFISAQFLDVDKTNDMDFLTDRAPRCSPDKYHTQRA